MKLQGISQKTLIPYVPKSPPSYSETGKPRTGDKRIFHRGHHCFGVVFFTTVTRQCNQLTVIVDKGQSFVAFRARTVGF